MSNYVPGIGAPNAKLMVIGEAPGFNEDAAQMPFVGPSGNLLNEMLQIAGINRDEIYATNVVKYRPPDNDLKRLKEIGVKIEDGLDQLDEEIRTIKPNVILVMGALSLRYVCGKYGSHNGITNYRGSILPSIIGGHVKCVASLHVANLLHQRGEGGLPYSARSYMQLDFNRAVEESHSPDFNLPYRQLEICKSGYQLYKFLEFYKSKNRVSVDIEVIKCIPVCIGLAFTPWHGISVPLMNLLEFERDPIANYDLNEMWLLLAETLERDDIEVIGQNIKFDKDKIRRPLGIRIRGKIRDTMLLAHTVHPEFPKKLEFLTSIYTKEPFYKNEYQEFGLKQKFETLLNYNIKDVCVTLEIYDELLKELDAI